MLGAGPNAALAHPFAANLTLREGDIVRCDVGGSYSGYYSDLARTAVVGRANSQQAEIYAKLWEIHEETIAAARPGAREPRLARRICRAPGWFCGSLDSGPRFLPLLGARRGK